MKLTDLGRLPDFVSRKCNLLNMLYTESKEHYKQVKYYKKKKLDKENKNMKELFNKLKIPTFPKIPVQKNEIDKNTYTLKYKV